LLPITVDSHFGEYLSWAWDIVDHRGILDFYDYYRATLTVEQRPEIELKLHERAIPIIEGIITDLGYEEAAVNVINDGLIEDLPSWVVVEVPAVINKDGVKGIKVPSLPKGYLALMRNYCGVYDLTAEAVLQASKELATQAIIANPVVNQVSHINDMVTRMIDVQSKWLGYLK
jgi:alpha-galactosidase